MADKVFQVSWYTLTIYNNTRILIHTEFPFLRLKPSQSCCMVVRHLRPFSWSRVSWALHQWQRSVLQQCPPSLPALHEGAGRTTAPVCVCVCVTWKLLQIFLQTTAAAEALLHISAVTRPHLSWTNTQGKPWCLALTFLVPTQTKKGKN